LLLEARRTSSGSGGGHQTRDRGATAELPLAITIDRDIIGVRNMLRDFDFALLYCSISARPSHLIDRLITSALSSRVQCNHWFCFDAHVVL